MFQHERSDSKIIKKFNIILILRPFEISTETLILCASDNLYIFKLDFSGTQGSGFILKPHSLALINQIF